MSAVAPTAQRKGSFEARETEHTEPVNPPSIRAEEIHKSLVRAHRLGNRLRREFLKGLVALEEGRLYTHLSAPSTAQYAEQNFQYEHSETYEMIRVGKILPRLRRFADAFDRGEINWSALKAITRVFTHGEAKAGENGGTSEQAWLEYARSHSVRRIKREVTEAIHKGRKIPRKKGDSMPNSTSHLAFEYLQEDYDIVEKAFRKVSAEMGKRLGVKGVEPHQVLLFMCRMWLETDAMGIPKKRVVAEEPSYTVLYHSCPECRAARLPTADGPIEISPEVVERVEADARKVTIRPEDERRKEPSPRGDDKPEEPPAAREKRELPPRNSATVRRRVLLRDGQVCSNPFCRRRLGLQGNHIRMRSRYGETEVWNEVAVCPCCHGLIHTGLLFVEGDPLTGLRWRRRTDGIVVDIREDLKFLASLEVLRDDEEWKSLGRRDAPALADSARAENRRPPAHKDVYLIDALTGLGYSKAVAVQRLKDAEEELERTLDRPATVDDIIRAAVEGGRRRR